MFIAIEGCIAAGKTTVAENLAAFRGHSPLLEDFEMNPFLRDFYQEPQESATETEFAFLLIHYHQLRKHRSRLTDGEVIADFHLGKDLIFAEMNMSEQEELALFRRLNALCSRRTVPPTILVFLSAPVSLLCERVSERGRDFEQAIDRSYYEQLNKRYEAFFEQHDGLKIKLDMTEWDCVQRPELIVQLSIEIDSLLSDDAGANGQA